MITLLQTALKNLIMRPIFCCQYHANPVRLQQGAIVYVYTYHLLLVCSWSKILMWDGCWQDSVTTVAVDHHDDRYVDSTARQNTATAVVTTAPRSSSSSSPPQPAAAAAIHDASQHRGSSPKTDSDHRTVSLHLW